MPLLRTLLLSALLILAVVGSGTAPGLRADAAAKPVRLSAEHIAAAGRDRRIIINFDTISGDRRFGGRDPAELVKWKFHVIDAADVQIDSVWWCWGEGNQSPWPSSIMPLYDSEGYRQWKEQGIDIAAIFAEESRKRGIESFYNYRINGSDNDLGPFSKLPMKLKHPEWLIHTWPGPVGLWNYAIPEVRRYKLSILREIAERFDYDGISLDFARVCPVLPPGKAWANRDKMTDFLREFRSITQEVAHRRGRPLLVGARIPENLQGCHFDGLDIETWVREGLVDVLALGIRSFDVDIAAFRRITAGTHVKLYPSVDDHHASDGYATPPIDIYRGVAANWWRQGADGIQTFNFNHAPDFPFREVWETHLTAYRKLGSPGTLHRKNKRFVVQRRGGGHGPTVIPNPQDWTNAPLDVLQYQHAGAAAGPAGQRRQGRYPLDRRRRRRPGRRPRASGKALAAPLALGPLGQGPAGRKAAPASQGGHHRPSRRPPAQHPPRQGNREPDRGPAEQRRPGQAEPGGWLAGL